MPKYGERSSVGRAPDCDSGGRGFEPHRSPQFVSKVFRNWKRYFWFDRKCFRARVAELVDALVLGTSGVTRESSSLSFRTHKALFKKDILPRSLTKLLVKK